MVSDMNLQSVSGYDPVNLTEALGQVQTKAVSSSGDLQGVGFLDFPYFFKLFHD